MASEPSVHALRSRAESLLPDYSVAQIRPDAAPEDVSTLLRELRLHEIELELQNASLRDSQVEVELSRARFRELYAHAPIAYLTLAENSRILDANDAALKLLQPSSDTAPALRGGASSDTAPALRGGALMREAVIGHHLSAYVDFDDVTTFARHRRALAGSDTSATCHVALRIGNALREVRIDSIRARDGSCESLTMITDLSDKRRLSRTLEAQAFTAAVLDVAGLIAVLDLHGQILQLNCACSALLTEPEAAIGQELWTVFATSPQQQADARHCFRSAVGQLKSPACECTFTAADGAQRHVAWSFTTLAERTAPVRYVIASGNDTTALQGLQAQLLAAERLAAIGQLAAGVGHEINNPLAYVKSSLEVGAALLDQLPEQSNELRHILDVAQEGVDRIRLIVDDLRILSSPDQRSVDVVDVRALLDTCVQLASNEIRHRARLTVNYEDVPMVTANAGRLSQVFLNLLVNAAQSIVPGDVSGNEILLSARSAIDGGVLVEVRDSGAGIADKDLEHIFEPFFTTKGTGSGTGLGLAISHGIIAELGGRISVDSTPGRGTTFLVWLPAASTVVSVAVASAPPPPVPAPAKIARSRILVIDDEPRIVEAFVLLLGKGHDIQTTSSGRAALELCQRQEFDLIFCDMRMPTMTGDEIYRLLQEQNPNQSRNMVFMTGSLMSERDLRALTSSEVGVLRKPFSAAELYAVLCDRLGRRAA